MNDDHTGDPQEKLNDGFKGMPAGRSCTLSTLGEQGWNVLRESLPLPLPVLKQASLDHNSRWMQGFLRRTGVKLCPHGKTTMSPQLWSRQLADGAWGLSLATAHQMRVSRRHGVQRILLANQLVSPDDARWVLGELSRDGRFDFYCLVDSVAGVERLANFAARWPAGRALQVLLELGIPGARCGCRGLPEAMEVAAAIRRAAPHLALRGVEAFEGSVKSGGTPQETEARVEAFLGSLASLARQLDTQQAFAPGPVLLSAGGSAYFDLVASVLRGVTLSRPVDVVLRSGCYLTHDSMFYRRHSARMAERSPWLAELGEPLAPALEVWAYVQSRPEPTRAILTLGKRDCSFDLDLPQPALWFRPGLHQTPQMLDAHNVAALNDQHALLDLPPDSPLAVGDLVGCGISHPCTTFDRWQWLPVVNSGYDVIGGVRTFF